jgi:hypothetical protein
VVNDSGTPSTGGRLTSRSELRYSLEDIDGQRLRRQIVDADALKIPRQVGPTGQKEEHVLRTIRSGGGINAPEILYLGADSLDNGRIYVRVAGGRHVD